MITRLLRFSETNLKYIVTIYVIVQLIFVVFFPSEFRSDSAFYLQLAQESIRANSFYPAQQHLYDDYIFAPLFVNIVILVLHIYNSAISIGIFNIILNLLQLYLLYKLTQIIFNKATASVVTILYMF